MGAINHIKIWVAFAIISCSSLISNYSVAQNAAARYEIDAKRYGISVTDNDALPRSREFIRLDSTYYVGWMVEGLYRYSKASDYIGYKTSIAPLRKALYLLEKDYQKTFKSLFSENQTDVNAYNKYYDLLSICQSLKESYDNIEMADSVMWILNKVDNYNFPQDLLRLKTAKAWTYHRNRFYTSKKFAFLKNSIEENETMALQNCYAALGSGGDNQQSVFGNTADKLNTYHYLAILHNYLKHYDSTAYYYEQMQTSGAVSYNNYGLFENEIGNFAIAKDYIARNLGSSYKKLDEPSYWIPMLEVYSGRTKQAISLSKTQIARNGSTPGFGWYNLALARSYLYDGQLDSSEYALNKAAGFKELHIGTTLTQVQYDFTVNLLKLQLIDKKIALEKFTKKGWWHSPTSLYNITSLQLDKFLLQYVLVNQMINNPERDRLVYDLFCNESTTTYDENWYLLKSLSLPYLMKKYEEYPKKDPRSNIYRYFKLFDAKLDWEDGNENTARKKLESIVTGTTLDTANEKLFLGRLYEGLAMCYDDNGDDQKLASYSNALLEEYPQLIPFSRITTRMKLNYSGLDNDVTSNVIDELKDCDIKWRNESNIPVVNISFGKKNNRYEALLSVVSAKGKVIVNQQRLVFKEKDEGVGKELALRIFGKGGGVEYDSNFQ
jgi:hypothetical protein